MIKKLLPCASIWPAHCLLLAGLGGDRVMLLLNMFWPSAFDEGQRRDNFLVRDLALIGRHVVWICFADHLFDPVFGHHEQIGIGVMPSVPRLVMRWRWQISIRITLALIRLTFQIGAMAGCAILRKPVFPKPQPKGHSA